MTKDSSLEIVLNFFHWWCERSHVLNKRFGWTSKGKSQSCL